LGWAVPPFGRQPLDAPLALLLLQQFLARVARPFLLGLGAGGCQRQQRQQDTSKNLWR